MKNLFFALFLLTFSLYSQEDVTDIIDDISIYPVYHGSLVIQYKNTTIYVDPYGGVERYKSFPKPNLIFITDIHGDHLNMDTLKEIDFSGATFIVPQAVNDAMQNDMVARTSILKNTDTTEVLNILIEAIPMYNLPEDETSRHPKGRGNGYILTINNKRIYISGDTEDIPEMRSLKNIDIAFVCMNFPFTMNIEQAASAVLAFKPAIVYPYHYRGRPDMSDVNAFKKLVNDGNNSIEVRLRDWYKN